MATLGEKIVGGNVFVANFRNDLATEFVAPETEQSSVWQTAKLFVSKSVATQHFYLFIFKFLETIHFYKIYYYSFTTTESKHG